ncbi:hypothetical protein STRDD11_02456 [Streptococcus sp. DD11]|nr:hypothetical protein STRDD11_02456 [Streptococcus sp. DD11]
MLRRVKSAKPIIAEQLRLLMRLLRSRLILPQLKQKDREMERRPFCRKPVQKQNAWPFSEWLWELPLWLVPKKAAAEMKNCKQTV